MEFTNIATNDTWVKQADLIRMLLTLHFFHQKFY